MQPSRVFAQDEQPVCGWTPPAAAENQNPPSSSCPYTASDILGYCIPIYVRVRFHFFVNDDCTGKVQITRFDNQPQTSQARAYKIAEDLVNQTNTSLANNERQWTIQGSEPVCNPVRFLLSGVEMHCKSNIEGGFDTDLLHEEYGGGILGSELDVYVADFPGNATGIGYTDGGFASIDWIDRGNLAHELGHVLNLYHTFGGEYDGCADTPDLSYNWDRNCDGDIGDTNEQGQQCWVYIGDSPFADGNQNGVHDCLETLPCTVSPCCSWANVDNNLMSYNAFKTALTTCQINRMVQDLVNNKCDVIAGVGVCPPPVATITQTAFDRSNVAFTSECLVLSASFNDVQHRFHLFKIVNGQEVPVYTPGWSAGTAKDFCFSTACSPSGPAVNRLSPNTDYRAKLWVQNSCGQTNLAVYDFRSPGTDCGGGNEGLTDMKISPNPGDGQVEVAFEGDLDEKFQLWATQALSGQTTLLTSDYSAVDGSNLLSVNIDSLTPGSYTITLLGDSHLYQCHFVKF